MYVLLHKYKNITIAIIAVATGGFFLWLFFAGGVSDITSPSKSCVVEVGSGCITVRDYRRELLRFSNLLQNEEMNSIIREQVISNLTAQELLYQKAKSLSLVASDEEVVEVIKSDPTFHENGFFTSTRYREVLSKAGMTPEEYEEYVRKTITLQKLISLITNGVYITEKELELNLLTESTLISGSLYVVSLSDVRKEYTPEEKELLEYYQKNRESFKRQEGKILRVWKDKDKEKALSIYRALKEGKQPEGFQEIRLPEQAQSLGENLKAEAQTLNPQNRLSFRKEGEEYIVLYLKEVLPAGYEEFEKVKEKVKEKLLEEKAEELALKKAQALLKNLKEGKNPEYRALNFSDTSIGQLNAVINMEGKDIVEIAVSKGKVFGPYSLRQGYGVLMIEKRSKKDINKEERKELARDILSLKAQAILTQYIEHMKKNTKIRVNKELIGGG
ncbi:MAG: peptidylprolyl isomerase [Aquificaceae bacterium]|nr:peptidylprolyl isomerase [Aquificaceae bacterium]